MQRIEVKNFGPLKDVSLDIKDYMIFIGPQASGKSTLAKLVWFFREFPNFLVNYYPGDLFGIHHFFESLMPKDKLQKDNSSGIKDTLSSYFNNLEFDSDLFKNNTQISLYYTDQLSIIVGINKQVTVSDDLKTLLESLSLIYEDAKANFSVSSNKDDRLLIARSLSFEIKKKLKDNSLISQENIFIPAARIIYALTRDYRLSSNPYSQLREGDFLDKFYSLIKNISEKIWRNSTEYFSDSIDNHLLENVLKGKVKFESINFDFEGNEKGLAPKIEVNSLLIDLKDASSGQQESLWILLLVIYFLKNKEKLDLIIEEPEAHLFPEAQRDLTYLISLLANQQGNQVLLTTHSPYILASLNNLLKAYTVGQAEKNKEAIGKIIDPLLWVDPDRVYVGYMENGEIKPILNPELQQIEHDLLDNVSNDIMTKFDELLEIQYSQ